MFNGHGRIERTVKKLVSGLSLGPRGYGRIERMDPAVNYARLIVLFSVGLLLLLQYMFDSFLTVSGNPCLVRV